MGTSTAALQHPFVYHDECQRQNSRALGEQAYPAALGSASNRSARALGRGSSDGRFRRLQGRQVAPKLERRHLGPVINPLGPLVAQEEVEDVLTQGLSHKFG
jgi:hypothetical protein